MEGKKRTEWLVPDYPPLDYKNAVGEAAVKGQIYHYPKVVRTHIDEPISNQSIGAFSLNLFSEPRTLRNGKVVYGFMKLRGNWGSKDQAVFQSSKIIREVDSKFQIRMAPVGAWVPITDEEAFIKDLIDVKTSEEETIQLRDAAAKEKQAEARRIQREIREREEEAQGPDIYDEPESLRYYSMKRVTDMTLVENQKRLKMQLENIEEKLVEIRVDLKTLELDHPEYKEEWVDCYNAERRKGGINDFIPREDQFDEYESQSLEELKEQLKENSDK